MGLLQRFSAFLASFKVTRAKIEGTINRLNITPCKNLDFTDSRAIRVAAVQYQYETYHTLREYIQALNDHIADAVKNGAQMVVFPELIGLSSLSLVPFYEKVRQKFQQLGGKNRILEHWVRGYSNFLFETYYHTFSLLAAHHRVYLAAGSCYRVDDKALYNRGFLFGPDGAAVLSQDKLFLSSRERAMGVQPGETVETAATAFGTVAMLLGQDEDYYEPFKIASLSGVDLVVVCGMDPAPYQCFRDLDGVASRAFECNLFCVKAAAVGRFITGEELEACSGVYGPPAIAKQPHGVIAQAQSSNQRETVYARLDLQKLNGGRDHYDAFSNEKLYERYSRHFAPQNTKA